MTTKINVENGTREWLTAMPFDKLIQTDHGAVMLHATGWEVFVDGEWYDEYYDPDYDVTYLAR